MSVALSAYTRPNLKHSYSVLSLCRPCADVASYSSAVCRCCIALKSELFVRVILKFVLDNGYSACVSVCVYHYLFIYLLWLIRLALGNVSVMSHNK